MPSIINANTSGGLISTADTSGVLQLQTASTTALTISAAQKIGIGTASVFGTGSNLSILGSPTAGQTSLVISDGATATIGLALGTPSASTVPYLFSNVALALGTNGAERMRITSAGDVGIGNTAPGAKLEVTGAIRSLRTGSTAAILQVINDNNSWNITSGTSTSQFRIDNNLVGTALTINNNGAVALAGASQTASGVGITFPATQSASSDANTLDDYEEGTWTPTISFGGSSAGVTYGNQNGSYTKIGRMVYCQVNFSLTNNGSATGIAAFGGLPFTAGNVLGNTGIEPGGMMTYFAGSSINVAGYTINPDEGTTQATIFYMPAGAAAAAQATDAYIGNSFDCRAFFSYCTA